MDDIEDDVVDEELVRARRRFERLVALYPRCHRQRYGAPLRDTFLDLYRSLPQPQRRSLRFWLAQAGDVLINSVHLHAYFFLSVKEAPPNTLAIRAGTTLGVGTGVCFTLGAFLYNLTPLLSGLGESVGNLACLLLLLLACAGSGFWTARHTLTVGQGIKAGMLTGGIIACLTGIAYLLLDTLFFGVTSQRPEKQAAFAHSHFADIRSYLLVTDLNATLVLTLCGLAAGLLLGGTGAGVNRLMQRNSHRG